MRRSPLLVWSLAACWEPGLPFFETTGPIQICSHSKLEELGKKKRNKTLSLWGGSTDYRTLDYQRTNPREYQIVRTHTRKPVEYKTQHHPTTSSTLCRMHHLNHKQNKNINPIISRQNYHLTQPCPSEEKQTNKEKLSTNLTLC